MASPLEQAGAFYEPDSGWNPVWAGSDSEPEEGPNYADDDYDGLPNWLEDYRGTDRFSPDTDMDGVTDGDEQWITGTDPCLWDTNGNSYSDYDDFYYNQYGYYPWDINPDEPADPGEGGDPEPQPLEITTTSLPEGTAGQTYETVWLAASGGEGSYSWSLSYAYEWPDGLFFEGSDGSLAGTPTMTGAFTLIAEVTDSMGTTVQRQLLLTVQEDTPGEGDPEPDPEPEPDPPAPLQFATSTTLPAAYLGQDYGPVEILVADAQGALSWEVTLNHSLAMGLNVEVTPDGRLFIAGIPTENIYSCITIQATDATGAQAVADFSIQIFDAPVEEPSSDTDGDGVTYEVEVQFGSDPDRWDSMIPGVSDWFYVYDRTGMYLSDTDADGDGLGTVLEAALGTRDDTKDTAGDYRGDRYAYYLAVLQPADSESDADGDGLSDALEECMALHMYDPDFDGDGLSDGEEWANIARSSPWRADTDGDGLNDALEKTLATDPRKVDTDGDHLTDYEEHSGGVMAGHMMFNPLKWSTAQNGIPDYHLANLTDTDGGGIPDRLEEFWGLNPANAADELGDIDSDGLSNLWEYQSGYDIRSGWAVLDTDGDGMTNVYEIYWGLDYLDPHDGADDPDGDWLVNLEEYYQGTDPWQALTPGRYEGQQVHARDAGTGALVLDAEGDPVMRPVGNDFEGMSGEAIEALLLPQNGSPGLVRNNGPVPGREWDDDWDRDGFSNYKELYPQSPVIWGTYPFVDDRLRFVTPSLLGVHSVQSYVPFQIELAGGRSSLVEWHTQGLPDCITHDGDGWFSVAEDAYSAQAIFTVTVKEYDQVFNGVAQAWEPVLIRSISRTFKLDIVGQEPPVVCGQCGETDCDGSCDPGDGGGGDDTGNGGGGGNDDPVVCNQCGQTGCPGTCGPPVCDSCQDPQCPGTCTEIWPLNLEGYLGGTMKVGEPEMLHLSSSGGVYPHTMSMSGGVPGLTFNNGSYGGTPSSEGEYEVSVTLTDAAGDTVTIRGTVYVLPPEEEEDPGEGDPGDGDSADPGRGWRLSREVSAAVVVQDQGRLLLGSKVDPGVVSPSWDGLFGGAADKTTLSARVKVNTALTVLEGQSPVIQGREVVISVNGVEVKRQVATGTNGEKELAVKGVEVPRSEAGDYQVKVRLEITGTDPEEAADEQFFPAVSERTVSLLPMELAPEKLASNGDFDEGDTGGIAAQQTGAIADNRNQTLIAKRDSVDGRVHTGDLVTDDLHQGWFGLRPGVMPDDFFNGATVTITRKSKTDPDTGKPSTGRVRLFATWGDKQELALPPDDPEIDDLLANNPAPRNLVGKVYGTNKTVPSGATFWIEGVSPGKITLEYRIQKGSTDIKHEQTFEVRTEWTKAQWLAVVRDEIYLDSFTTSCGAGKNGFNNTGIDMNQYVVANDFLPNRPYIYSVYEYYAKLHDKGDGETATGGRDKFLWAGLAKLAGAPVYGGMSDAQNGRSGLAIASFGVIQESILKGIQDLLIDANINIYNDLAYQFVAYRTGGLKSLEHLNKIGEIRDDNYNAWKLIDGGEATNVASGNQQLLQREQQVILAQTYTDLLNMWDGWVADAFSWLTRNPIVGGPSFQTVIPNGNIAVFADRWGWITHPQQGMWLLWTSKDKYQRQSLANSPLRTNAANFAFFSRYSLAPLR